MRMLSNDDLRAIGAVVDVKIQANNAWLDKKFDEKLEPVLEAVRDGFEEMDRRWDEKLGKGLGSLRHELMEHTDRTVNRSVGELRSELKGDIGGLRSELKGDIGGLRSELKGDIGSLRSELRERDLIG